MRSLLLVLCLLVLALAARANDGRVTGISGTVRFVRDEKTTIRMLEETVTMDLYPTRYLVTAEFTFTNTGPATSVKMGFPETGGGVDIDSKYYRTHSSFVTVQGGPAAQLVAGRRPFAEFILPARGWGV